jgi:hypothetical protein
MTPEIRLTKPQIDRLFANQLVQELISLQLPNEDFAIFGSGLMLAFGLQDSIPDLDVIARGAAWEQATTLADPHPAKSGEGRVVRLFKDDIEIFDKWTQEIGT